MEVKPIETITENQIEVQDFPVFTQEDFLTTTTPYEFVYQFKDDRFSQERILNRVSINARAVKVLNFKALYKEYEKRMSLQSGVIADNTTQFEDQEIELSCGHWQADDMGVSTMTPYGEMYACVHPILPVLRLTNIDTGIEKLKIAFRKGRQWRYVIADKKTLASNNSILSLADLGIAVTSENSKYLVRYLHDVENLNYELIPEKNSVSRLGWIDGAGFSPYVEELLFDGDLNFKTFFESVSQRGSYEKWIHMAKEVRRGGIPARMVLAASFASVLVKPLGGLPFFFHLWGGTEAGKTVALMLAASVWANPEIGRYVHTFNSTAVGMEKSAAFVNSLPLILDELQIVRDRKDFDRDIYTLSEGAGRTRGTKTGGVDQTPTWANCILTSGEMPITGQSSGAGAVNRILEVECQEKLFAAPREVADTVKKNYGFAGKEFVKRLEEEDSREYAAELFKGYFTELSQNDTTEKQAMSAAILLTADRLCEEWLFEDGRALTAEEIKSFLQSKAAVSVHERAYQYLCEFVVQNRNRFCGKSQDNEVWGNLPEGEEEVWIVRREFDRICSDAGFHPKAFLSWLRDRGKIEVPSKGFEKTKRINGIPCHCVILRLLDETDDETYELIEEINQ